MGDGLGDRVKKLHEKISKLQSQHDTSNATHDRKHSKTKNEARKKALDCKNARIKRKIKENPVKKKLRKTKLKNEYPASDKIPKERPEFVNPERPKSKNQRQRKQKPKEKTPQVKEKLKLRRKNYRKNQCKKGFGTRKQNKTLIRSEYLRNKRKRQKMRKRMGRLRKKLKDVVRDSHWKFANFYCQNYDTIVIPRFNYHRFEKEAMRNYGFTRDSEMIQKMMSLSHGKFLTRLKYTAQKYEKQVLEQNESYTTKTCGSCGRLHWKIGSKKVYNCKHCGMKADRDVNAARNIFIRNVMRITQAQSPEDLLGFGSATWPWYSFMPFNRID